MLRAGGTPRTAIGSGKELANLAKSVDAKYGTTGLGEVRWVLGMLMERDRLARTISICQEAFIDSILARFDLVDVSTVSTPLVPGTQLSAADCPAKKDEKEMGTRPYREKAKFCSVGRRHLGIRQLKEMEFLTLTARPVARV